MSETSLNIINRISINTDTMLDEFQWVISHFKEKSNNIWIESFIFSTSNDEKVKWKLKLFVNKNNPTQFVGVYLYLMDCDNVETFVFFKCSLIKNDGSECSRFLSYSDEKKYTHNNCSLQFMTFNEFINKFVNNDAVHIRCTVKWSTVPFVQKLSVLDDLKEDYLCKVMTYSLHLDETFSNVCLDVAGVHFWVHKKTLAARSSVFSAMFEHDMKEKKENVVKIKEIEPEVMKAMLKFIYTNHVDDLESKVIELLQASDMYDVKDLKLLCEQSLIKSLNVDNAYKIFYIADISNVDNLKQLTIKFIKNKCKSLIGISDI